MTTDELVLRAGDATARLSADGGRLTSLVVDGCELLVGPDSDPMRWGSYPMVPWAGRVRHGRFSFDGRHHELPITAPPHAIHGTAYLLPWRRTGGSLTLEFGEPWPFAGTVTQRIELDADHLELQLTLRAHERQPAMVGWHPWFRRSLDPAAAAAAAAGATTATATADGPAELVVEPVRMFELDDEMIPTGALVAPTPQPWDNCFEVATDPVIRWPGQLELTLRSDCRYWTIYTHPPHALCVEPQSDAPDAFNREPTVLEPGHELAARFDLSWR